MAFQNRVIDKLKFWCHKIIPLVYEDSLSYYETVCKVSSKLNEVVDEVNNMGEAVEQAVDTVNGFDGDIEALDQKFTNDIRTVKTDLANKVDALVSLDGLQAYTFGGEDCIPIDSDSSNSAGKIPLRNQNGNLTTGAPENEDECVPKSYADEKVPMSMVGTGSNVMADKIVVRNSRGNIVSNPPNANNELTTKQYVDSEVAKRVEILDGGSALHAYTFGHSPSIQIDTDDLKSVATLPMRNVHGNLTTGTPVNDDECVPKSYVDNLPTGSYTKTLLYENEAGIVSDYVNPIAQADWSGYDELHAYTKRGVIVLRKGEGNIYWSGACMYNAGSPEVYFVTACLEVGTSAPFNNRLYAVKTLIWRSSSAYITEDTSESRAKIHRIYGVKY